MPVGRPQTRQCEATTLPQPRFEACRTGTDLTNHNETNEAAAPPDQLLDVGPLTNALRHFARDRDWEQFHSPKNLVMALTGEVGELAEIFQWMTEDASKEAARNPATAQAVSDELSDVLLYVIRTADVLGVDLNAAVTDKLRVNAEKYPVQTARGSSKKYTEL